MTRQLASGPDPSGNAAAETFFGPDCSERQLASRNYLEFKAVDKLNVSSIRLCPCLPRGRSLVVRDVALLPEVACAETGRRALFLNPLLSLRFEGMTEAESAPILNYLLAHLSFLPFTARVRWQPGTVVLWDNWAAAHSAIGDYHGWERTMERVTLQGDRPDGPAGADRQSG